MNSELAAASAYNKLDQKSVTAWLHLRNKAAHGKYADYSIDQGPLVAPGGEGFCFENDGLTPSWSAVFQ